MTKYQIIEIGLRPDCEWAVLAIRNGLSGCRIPNWCGIVQDRLMLTFIPFDRDQLLASSPVVRDWLGQDDLAPVFIAAAE